MTMEYVNNVLWTPKNNKIYFYYTYIWVEFGNFGGVILLTLCVEINIYPNEYSQETLFILVLFLDNTIHSSTIIEILTLFHNIHIIHNGIIHYSYRHQFHPNF